MKQFKLILDGIWKFINSKFFGYGVAILLVIFLANQCKNNADLKRDSKIKDQNIAAADSTINEYISKDKKYEAEKAVWILTEKQLKEENRGLYDQVHQQSGRIISLNNVIFQLKQDTAILHDTINYLKAIIGKAKDLGKGNWEIPWELNYTWDKTNFDHFEGHSIVYVDSLTKKVIHKSTLMDKRLSNIDLTFGEKVVDGKYNVYVTSAYPGLTAKSLNGFFTDPNSNKDIKSLITKQHWFTGFSFSIGITPTYDLIYQRPTVVFGPTIGYTIYQW